MVLAQTDSDAAEYVERTPNAVGTVTLAQVGSEQRKLNVLSLDGVAATPAMLEAGRYPLSKDLILITRNDASDAVRAFAEFVTSNAESRAIQRRLGLVSR
jgi:phosphate transport system substrate-binding protein